MDLQIMKLKSLMDYQGLAILFLLIVIIQIMQIQRKKNAVD